MYGHDIVSASSVDDIFKGIMARVMRNSTTRSAGTKRPPANSDQVQPDTKRPSVTPSVSRSTSTSVSSLVEEGVPQGPPKLVLGRTISKVSVQQRDKALAMFYEQFCRVYANLKDGKKRAHDDALREEAELYAQSSPKDYHSKAAPILMRLRKRPVASTLSEAGIMKEYSAHMEVQSKVSKFGMRHIVCIDARS